MTMNIRTLLFIYTIFATQAFGADIQELFPGNNVSVKYIVEFRARSGIPGHAFVALGRELDNGLVVFEAVGGFYPQDGKNKLVAVKNVANGPGVVDYKWKDLDSDAELRVPVTQEQSVKIVEKIGAWNDKNYSLLSQNCVDMAKEVANTVGINTDDTSPVPYEFVKSIKVKYEVLVKQRADADAARRDIEKRKKEEALKAEAARKAEAVRRVREIESAQRTIEHQRQSERQFQLLEQAHLIAEQAEMARRAAEQAEAVRRAADQAEAARRAAEAARQPQIIIH